MSRRSAPSPTRRRACAMAACGSRKRPPSEKESGVTLSTPMTSGRALARSAANTSAPDAGPSAEVMRVSRRVAILWPLRGQWRRVKRRKPSAWRAFAPSVAHDGRQLLGDLDPARHRIHRRKELHQFALGVRFLHLLDEPLRIAKFELR